MVFYSYLFYDLYDFLHFKIFNNKMGAYATDIKTND